MRKFLNIFILLVLLTPNFIYPQLVKASNQNDVNERKLENIVKIRNAEKLPINQTLESSDYTTDRFVVFVNKNNKEKSLKKIKADGGVISIEDENTYGKVKAIPITLSYMKSDQKRDFLNKLDADLDTVAVVPVQKRNLSTVSTPNDPLFPTDTSFDTNKQWYLSQPANGMYGIDILRAWQYLDSKGISYNGNSDVKVAVIDTGAAFENYTKYNQYTGSNKMVSPTAWSFTKASDFTNNILNNTGETANNQLDDDNKSDPFFCIDRNSNTQCDSGESANYIDDKNGLNIVDWGKYWSQISYTEYTGAPVCTNEPYHTDGVKCVSTFSQESLCTQDNLENYLYYGCYASDMGHPNDVHGHGTLVSNIITSAVNNGISGAGIASGVTLVPIKIFGESYNDYRSSWVYDSAYGDQIANAVNYAVEIGVDIINMSFAGSSVDYYEKLAIDNAYYNHDVLIIASSGNTASSTVQYPAGYTSVMSVGASNRYAQRASYSSYGSTLDLSAPVDNGIYTQGLYDAINAKYITTSCSWDSSQSCMNVDPMATPSPFSTFGNLNVAGTSFAAPQVVGVAALLKSIYPNLTSKQIVYLLEMSTSPAGSLVYSTSTGHGVLNALSAVQASDYKSSKLTSIKRMYQTMIGTDGYLYTRYSDTFGAKWTGWIKSGTVKVRGGLITQKIPNSDVVVQIVRGTNNLLYTRHSTDFGYTDSNDSGWSSWVGSYTVGGGIYPVISGNNLVISFKGTNGVLYTMYTSDGINWNTTTSSQFASGAIQMTYDRNSGNIIQGIRSTSGYVYTRYSSNNGVSWSNWMRGGDVIASDPVLYSIANKTFLTVRRKDNIIVTRYSIDGGSTWVGRSRTYGTSGMTKSTITMTESVVKGTVVTSWWGIDNKIYTRYTENGGASWSSQVTGKLLKYGRYALTPPTMIDTNGFYIIQTIRASDSYLYQRRSGDGGKTWSSWKNTGSIKITGSSYMWFEEDLNRLYTYARGTDGYVYMRMSDNNGGGFTSWYKSGRTVSGIRTDSTVMETLNLTSSD